MQHWFMIGRWIGFSTKAMMCSIYLGASESYADHDDWLDTKSGRMHTPYTSPVLLVHFRKIVCNVRILCSLIDLPPLFAFIDAI